MTDRRKGGRNPKLDPAVNRYCVRFTGEENKRLLAMFKQSGMPYMACFIKAQFFGQEFKTFTDNGSMKPYNDKLASLNSQFRQFGNDYNLALKELKVRFSESHAIQLLHRMEKSLMQMGEVMDKARQLTEDVRNRQNKNDKRI